MISFDLALRVVNYLLNPTFHKSGLPYGIFDWTN